MRKYYKKKPDKRTFSPLTVSHHTHTFTVYFIQHHKRIHWIVQGKSYSEPDILKLLDISERTARAWRNQTQPPCKASLLLLFMQATGRILPAEWARKGFIFKGNCLHYGDAAILREDLEELDYHRWQLKQTTEALKALPDMMRRGRAGLLG